MRNRGEHRPRHVVAGRAFRAHERLLIWLFGPVAAVTIVLQATVCFRGWVGHRPYGGDASGTVVAKKVIAHESRYGSSAEYVLQTSLPGGGRDTVVVPQVLYGEVPVGSHIERHENRFDVVLPDGRRINRTFPPGVR